MSRRRNSVRFIGIALATTLVIFAAIAIWRQMHVHKTVLSYDTVTASSRFGNAQTVTVRTRRVRVEDLEFEEVELGPDTWADCRGDCAETLRKQSIDFWETRRRREH